MSKTREKPASAHEIRYHRGDGVWYAQLVADERCHTWGRTLREAREHARDAVALWLDVDEDTVEIVDVWDLDQDTATALDEARSDRQAASLAQQRAHDALRSAAVRLTRTVGLSMRDAADLLGISHQRVQQIVRAAPDRQR